MRLVVTCVIALRMMSGLSVERIRTRRVCPCSVAAIATGRVSISFQIDNAHDTRLANLELVPTRTVGFCCVSHCRARCCFLF
jgi:hypothetical protein